MKMEANTTLSYSAYKTYNLFTFLHKKKSNLIFYIVWVSLMILLSPIMIWNILHNPDSNNMSLILLLLILICPWLIALIVFLQVKFSFKTVTKLFSEPVHYIFYQEYFTIIQRSQVSSATSDCRYDILESIHETKKYFYFFISGNQAHIVAKDEFTLGTPEELGHYLSYLLGSKFHKHG